MVSRKNQVFMQNVIANLLSIKDVVHNFLSIIARVFVMLSETLSSISGVIPANFVLIQFLSSFFRGLFS